MDMDTPQKHLRKCHFFIESVKRASLETGTVHTTCCILYSFEIFLSIIKTRATILLVIQVSNQCKTAP